MNSAFHLNASPNQLDGFIHVFQFIVGLFQPFGTMTGENGTWRVLLSSRHRIGSVVQVPKNKRL